jgi:hypothetical protein
MPISFLSGAMLTARDGIVGSWTQPGRPPGVRGPEDDDHSDQMSQWEPWVRRQVIGFDLLTSLKFCSKGKKSDACGTLSADAGEIVTIFRPTPEDVRQHQLPQVFGYADLRRDRASEIQSQITEFFPFFTSVYLNYERSQFTLELLDALRFVVVSTQMRVKHALAMPRPVDFSAQIMPMIQTPGHSSFPAGHAVESFMFATVLAELAAEREKQLYGSIGPLRDQLMRVAARISVNRVVAGVHFPVDLAAGMVLGSQLGRYFVALTMKQEKSKKGKSEKEVPFHPWEFNANYYGAEDFHWRDMLVAMDSGQALFLPGHENHPFLKRGNQFGVLPDSASPLRWLWQKAAAEWLAFA